MEFRGTPGKWSAETTADGAYEIIGAADNGNLLIICSRQPWGHRADMSLANARAIAAVPEMIEALGRALNAPRGTSGRILLEAADEEILRAALTAAVGG